LRECIERGCCREETVVLLLGLGSEIEGLFAGQEQELARAHYPGIKAHRLEHAALILNLHALARELSRGAAVSPGECLEQFSERLEAHFDVSDHRLEPYLERAQLMGYAERAAC
jgi:hemerythrin